MLKYASPVKPMAVYDVQEAGTARRPPKANPLELALLTEDNDVVMLVLGMVERRKLIWHLQFQKAEDSSGLCRWGIPAQMTGQVTWTMWQLG